MVIPGLPVNGIGGGRFLRLLIPWLTRRSHARVQGYAGRDGNFTLYEDEGVNYNYKKGAFSEIPLTYDEQEKTLTIGACQGSFPGMLEK